MFSSRSSSTSTYKTKYSLEERIRQSELILAKYYNYIPVIVECDPQIGTMKKQKFLVPQNVNCSHMIVAVRKLMSSTGGI